MHNNFQPIHIRKAKLKLEQQLKAYTDYKEEMKVYKKGVLAPTLWQKVKSVFKKF